MTIGADDHEVFDVGRVELDVPLHGIVERRLAGRHLEAHGLRRAVRHELRDARGIERQARAVVLPRFAVRFGLLAFLAQAVG